MPKNRNASWTTWAKLKLLLLLELLVLSGLLTACATKSPDSTPALPHQPAAIPALPATLAKPPSPESSLERAQKNIEEWRRKLTNSATN